MYAPVKALMDRIPVEELSGKAGPTASSARELVSGLLASAALKRRPLRLQKFKPVAIQTYVPKFQDHYSIDKKRYDPNRDRADQAKLAFQYKKEFKGAQRELRKDAAFVARRRIEEIKEKDAAYKKSMDRAMGILASQEGAMRGTLWLQEAEKGVSGPSLLEITVD
ncbi:Nop14-like family-domain-containing protein [Blyttiomyces helicus]|uniref:Nop14-like family-domain-containing protein n=1 Tax=Blyttiomyces helicus TaxID=388810 RepID=A0A4P9WDU6_9FUNG|nr:Nop14-like family-domain-containing protein [Blyttiomyces helicus]|eukprot:RKO90744.1 Nop14-like family-domain-containing protein [Blyttiomyces helicus]